MPALQVIVSDSSLYIKKTGTVVNPLLQRQRPPDLLALLDKGLRDAYHTTDRLSP